jgi:hypothetical protein
MKKFGMIISRPVSRSYAGFGVTRMKSTTKAPGRRVGSSAEIRKGLLLTLVGSVKV